MARPADDYESFRQVVHSTAAMVSNPTALQLAAHHQLQVLNVTWEDTGRYKGSCVGPNISDMTLQVQLQNPKTQQYELTCLPVIRYDNFSDRTADIDPDHFYLLVGNEDGEKLRRVSLRRYLEDLRAYMSEPDSWTARHDSMLSDRDSHVLVSAQACFLPIPEGGEVQFNPVLFNYQSYGDDPAVLTILATREGTSMTVIDNKRDAFDAGMTWGQRLFFNQDGERASLTGKRMSDFLAQNQSSGPSVDAAGQEGLNMVLLIQVPLKQKNPMRAGMDMEACAPTGGCLASSDELSDVENAVVGHGKVEGPFTEIAGLPIERDPRFPIRVTVQFYKATSNGAVSAKDVSEIAAQIEKVYEDGEYVGSLVTGGETGRPTEYEGSKEQPADWWSAFWKRHEQNTGKTAQQAFELLKKLNLVARPWMQ
ncbi:MAG: hypothetical protein HY319_30065 [Armatimonadetes bacterium]|nr:hypothetical protein [Armatimonadota bacterium]